MDSEGERNLLKAEEDRKYSEEEDIGGFEKHLASSNQNEVENIQELIDEETAEPDLMFICQKDPEAVDLLKKCSKWASDCKWTSNISDPSSNWETMKKYLTDINDLSVSQTEGQMNPKNFIRNFYLGVCNFRQRKYEEALSFFLEAYKFKHHYQINYNIALCYIKLGNLENAVFYLEAVIKQNKNFFFAYYNLIKIYLKKNNNQEAHLIYKEFSEIMKKENEKEKNAEGGIAASTRLSVNSFNTLKLFYKIGAECLFAMRYYQDCLYSILESLKFNPDDAELWFLYAKVFVMKKNFEFAIPLIKRALEIEPDYPEATKLLKFLEENMG
ncbi:MAG: tetratricopeptide repeat protein [archaeon]|nr:tetratricopeptide repeat protein [archaeon]